MYLYLMRHARALALEDSNVQYDAERPLSGAGERDILALSEFMKKMEYFPHGIFTGPFNRSRMSGEMIADQLGGIPVHMDTSLLPGAGLSDVLNCLSGLDPDKQQAAMVILHEPDISYILGQLFHGEDGQYPYPIYSGDFFALRLDINNHKAVARTLSAFSPVITRCGDHV
ncbi:histidine phosphatase family protein [Lentisphaera profundi]|uniref:Histidine phosphatase family protein n=1 Tax=Lentisphaera profundi TaxID=1658616 RepID=A0ABY7VZL3_9BACT|nr:histidine phosphatase family protein [Lentisphaera profundi]WDE98154.1 histidine phosphatase family protein [Lentisphaera profundi]